MAGKRRLSTVTILAVVAKMPHISNVKERVESSEMKVVIKV
jgi:hypothetical protein